MAAKTFSVTRSLRFAVGMNVHSWRALAYRGILHADADVAE